jgi:rfaE bifunctional protein nucleotidyltransferase chain/domain
MQSKIVTRDEAVALCQAYKVGGKRVGYTSGVFDLLHPGHVAYLEAAKKLVDVLVVGVNSDLSVRANKGPSRPITSERERALVLAGLASVDHLFIFGERNNNVNVELLKPDLYIKAGDYSSESLSSKKIVESYGGRVELVPFEKGLSTTSIIEKISLGLISDGGQKIEYKPAPAVFLDRDGTINEHVEYLSDPKKFVAIPGSLAAMKKLSDHGYRVIVVSNQPGVGLGYFSIEDLYAVNREMMRQATQEGCSIDKIYFCPHSKADKCRCRKPGLYFIERAAQELAVDIAKSFVIGDMTTDVKLGLDAGCGAILVKTGRGGADGIVPSVTPTFTARDLAEAAEWILQQAPGR